MRMRAIVGAAILIGALGATLPPAQPAHAATTISFWVRDSDAPFTQPLVKAYNASHTTQIKLNIIPAAQFVAKFGTSIAGGSAPDEIFRGQS